MYQYLMKKGRLYALGIAFMVGVLTPLTAPSVTQAASKDAACTGFSEVLGDSCGGNGGENDINSTIVTVINILSIVVGIMSVIMIIIAGMKYITASGDPGSIKSARNTIIYALVGIAIVALAQTIVKFVVKEVINKNASDNIGNNASPI